jgi:hypothetical protein
MRITTISRITRAYQTGSPWTPSGSDLRRFGDPLKEQILAERDEFILGNQELLLAEIDRTGAQVVCSPTGEKLLVAV